LEINYISMYTAQLEKILRQNPTKLYIERICGVKMLVLIQTNIILSAGLTGDDLYEFCVENNINFTKISGANNIQQIVKTPKGVYLRTHLSESSIIDVIHKNRLDKLKMIFDYE
jgi:hypothetical protein